MKKIICILTAIAALAFTGCSKKSSLPKAVLGTTSWPTNMFYYLAESKGFFEKNGASISVTDFSSTTESTSAFIGGQIDFVTFASPETISPFMEGADFKIVLISDKSNGCEGIVAKPEIKTAKDLKGKTVATQIYSVDHMFLLTLLKDNGMTQDDVKIVDMSIAQSGSAFVAGKCDAAAVWDPYFSNAKAAGGTSLYSSADNPDLITDSLGASVKICKEHPEVVQAIVQGFYDAVAYWKENPEEANAFMGEKLGVDAEEFVAEMAGLIIPTKEEGVKALTPASDYGYWGYTQNVIRDFMYDLGAIKSKSKDCGEMIDSSFVKKLK